MRVGIGYDVHALVKGRRLFIGGIEFPGDSGLLGHSDGDVLIHAISDAILGALCQDDIGAHFPDTDPSIEGIRSTQILGHVVKLTEEKGFTIANIDAIVIAEEPKIGPYREKIKKELSSILHIDPGHISVKGKTNEAFGFVGKKEGIVAYAVALLDEMANNGASKARQ